PVRLAPGRVAHPFEVARSPHAGGCREPSVTAPFQMMDPRTRTLVRALAITAGLLAIAVILWLDRVTPNYYSFEIFYVIPILAVTLIGGSVAAGRTGAVAAIAWTFDTLQEDGFAPSSVVWNVGTRLVIFIG